MGAHRNECEVKLEGSLELSALFDLGGELLGQGLQKDIYLAGDYTWRVREEGGRFVLAQKKHDVGRSARLKEVSDQLISEEEARRLMKARGVRVLVCKKRTSVRLGDAVIRLDEVEHLGQFIEISATSEESLFQTLTLLGLDRSRAIKASYLELMIALALPRWVQLILRFHEKVGVLAFGITSGILTTVGVLAGVNSATSSQLSVVAAIAAIAIADNCSDAFGMYVSKLSERGNSRRVALRYALGTLAGKFFFPLTFIVPLLLCPLSVAIWIDLTWGAIALALLSAEQAIVDQQSVPRRVGRNLTLAAVIVAISVAVGRLVGEAVG